MFATKTAKTTAASNGSVRPSIQPALPEARSPEQTEDSEKGKQGAVYSSALDLSSIPVFSPQSRRNSQTFFPKPLSSALAPRLRIGRADDPLEHEATRIADTVMSSGKSDKGGENAVAGVASLSGTIALQRKCAEGTECGECDECREKNEVLRRSSPGTTSAGWAPPSVHDALRSPAQPLDASARNFMEPRFGRDFSRVRVHHDAKAGESAVAVGARAYTVGQDVVFAPGHYAPATAIGRRLIAHELAHVTQQSESIHRLSVQRDTVTLTAIKADASRKPDQTSRCIVNDADARDGDSGEIYPARMSFDGTLKDYVTWGKKSKNESVDAMVRRIITAFVNRNYGANDRPKALAVLISHMILETQGVDVPECAWPMFISTHLMDKLHQVTGVELRSQKAGADKKTAGEAAKAQQQARKASGKEAEKREKAAGLPPPPGQDTEDKTALSGPDHRLSGSEYKGPTEGHANSGALPAKLTGPELQPLHGTGTYRMELDYSFAGSDQLTQVVEAMNYVSYHWEMFDITDLVKKGLSEENKNSLKQIAPNAQATVGKMAATGRRGDYAFEDLKEEASTSASDLAHPTRNATTGSPSEVVSKSIANFDNLSLLPASAITSAGGWALGALADLLGGTFQEREIPWPDRSGYYMVRCIASPDAQGTKQRSASVAIQTVELRDLRKLAKNALLDPEAQLAEKRAALAIASKKVPPDVQEITRLTKELSQLEVRTNGSAGSVIQQTIDAEEREKQGASPYRRSQIDRELTQLHDQLDLANSRVKGLTNVFRPHASLVSKITGQTYPLLLQMATVTPEHGSFAYTLSDVTSRDGKVYHGEADNARDAAWNAVRDFAGHNDYGPGMMGIAMPAGSAFEFADDHIESKSRDTAIAKKRIDDLVKVLVVLGLFVPGVGEVALVLGAALAAEHLLERWQNGTLRFDESTVSDLIGVLSAVFAGASIVGKLRVVRTSESFLLKSAVAAGRAAEIGNKALNYGGMMWGTLHDLNDIMADNEAELEGTLTHAEARRNRANKIASAVQTGALVFSSLKSDLVGPAEHPAGPTTGDATTPSDRSKTTAREHTPSGPQDHTTPTTDMPLHPGEASTEPPRKGRAKGDEHGFAPKEAPVPAAQDPKDPVANSGKPTETIDPKGKVKARAATFDGLHELSVLEDGRIIRCSLSCGELRTHYNEFLESAKKDADPERQKAAKDLDARLKSAEDAARNGSDEEKQAAATDAAKLEPELRSLAARDLAAETGVSIGDMEKLLKKFLPTEVRGLRTVLGDTRFKSFAAEENVPAQLSRLLAVAGSDVHVHDAAVGIVADGYGKLSSKNLASALTDLTRLQREMPGHVSPEFLAGYRDALANENVGQAKKLLAAEERTMREKKQAEEAATLATAPDKASAGSASAKAGTRIVQQRVEDPNVTVGSGQPWTGTGPEPAWGNPRSEKAYDHIEGTHGPKRPANQLQERANRKAPQQGQWYSSADFVIAEQIAPKHPGRYVVDFGRPIGRVHNRGGAPTENVTRAYVERNPDGTLNSSYPVDTSFKLR